jgi:TonB family protein
MTIWRNKPKALLVCAMFLIVISGTKVLAAPQKDAFQPTRVRVSHAVLQLFIVHKVLPEYPEAALERGIQGVVTISVLVDQNGVVQKAWDANGDPALVPAVSDAVKQWKFKPYYLNKKPVQVEGQVVVTFELNGTKGIVR